MKPSVSVIIVTWNGKELLKEYLPSVVNTRFESFEIIIADNASTDGTAEWVRHHFPDCKVVSFSRNHGFCGGNNRAVSYASGELLVFLNNDVRTDPDWLTHLTRPFSDPGVAAAQPKIRSALDTGRFDHAGAAGGYLDLLGYPFCRGRVFHEVEKDEGQYDQPTDLFWASGAAMAIRKELFLDLGGFDERFEFHMEEIDLCWRLLNRDYNIAYAPESVVWHLGGASLDRADPRKTYYNFRNSLFMIWKNATTDWLKKRFVLRLFLDGLAGIHAILSGRPGDLFAILRAHMSFYRQWRIVHKERLVLETERTVRSEPEEMIRTSIIDEFYLRGNRTFREIVARVNRREA